MGSFADRAQAALTTYVYGSDLHGLGDQSSACPRRACHHPHCLFHSQRSSSKPRGGVKRWDPLPPFHCARRLPHVIRFLRLLPRSMGRAPGRLSVSFRAHRLGQGRGRRIRSAGPIRLLALRLFPLIPFSPLCPWVSTVEGPFQTYCLDSQISVPAELVLVAIVGRRLGAPDISDPRPTSAAPCGI